MCSFLFGRALKLMAFEWMACVRLFLENIEEYLAAAPAWHFHEQSIIQNV